MLGIFQLEQKLVTVLDHSRYKLKAINHMENHFESMHTRGADVSISHAEILDFDRDINTMTLLYPDGVELKSEVVDMLVQGNVKKVKLTGSWQLTNGEAGSISATTMVSRFSEFD
jgi:hypothetical protein